MKNLIWIIVAAVVAVGVYLVVSGKPAEEAAEAVSGASVEAPEALESAADATGEAVEAATEAADVAVDDAAVTTQEGVDTAPEATEQATQAATGAVEGATEEATNTATDTATDVLSVDGFNLEQVTEMIDGSGLDGLRKETLKGALKNAAGNPELLQSVLDMVKDSLGQ